MECLNDMLVRNARNIGDKTYIITDEESVTFAQFDARKAARGPQVLARLLHEDSPVSRTPAGWSGSA